MKTPDIEKFLKQFTALLVEFYQEEPLNFPSEKAKERAKAFVNSLKTTQSYEELKVSTQRGIGAVIKSKKKREDALLRMKQAFSKRYKSKDVTNLLLLASISEPVTWLNS